MKFKLLFAALALAASGLSPVGARYLPGEGPGPLPGYTCYRMLTAGYSICGTQCWGDPAVFCIAFNILDGQ